MSSFGFGFGTLFAKLYLLNNIGQQTFFRFLEKAALPGKAAVLVLGDNTIFGW